MTHDAQTVKGENLDTEGHKEVICHTVSPPAWAYPEAFGLTGTVLG